MQDLRSVFFALVALVAAAEGAAQIPNRVESLDPARKEPVWVASAGAVNGGTPVDGLFTSQELVVVTSMLEMARAATEAAAGETDGGCPGWIHFAGSKSKAEPIGQLLAKSVAALSGMVVAEAPGFYRGVPGTLYEIQVERYLKLPAGVEARATLWMPHGQVAMDVDGVRLCVASPSFPAKPGVGGRILVFVHQFDVANPRVVRPFEASLFFEDAEGRVWSPGPVKLPDWEHVEHFAANVD